MTTNLLDFITKLSEDPKFLEEYQKDPDAVLNTAGFSRAELAILKSRDSGILRALVNQSSSIIVFIYTYTFTNLNSNTVVNTVTNTVTNTNVVVAFSARPTPGSD